MSLENLSIQDNQEGKAAKVFESKDKNLTPQQLDEKYLAPAYKKKRFLSSAADFVPVVGSYKMIHEAVIGKQLGTKEKIKGWRRLVHGAAGAAFLASDLTGIGSLASLGGKALMRGSIKVGEKVLEKKLLMETAEKVAEKSAERAALRASDRILEEQATKMASNSLKRNSRQEKIREKSETI